MENLTLNDYFKKVREQLDCNATDEYKNNYITYLYTNEEVDEHLDYFARCKDFGLSAYKALLFFGDYMQGDYDI